MNTDRNRSPSRPLLQRLRPFWRRELKTRLASALVAVLMLLGLSWLSVSTLTGVDSAPAHQLRTTIGLENGDEMCGGFAMPSCTYDDKEQAVIDAAFRRDRQTRLAVLGELVRRSDRAQQALDALERDSSVFLTAQPTQNTIASMQDLIWEAAVDVSPTHVARDNFTRREALMAALDSYNVVDCDQVLFDGLGFASQCARDSVIDPHHAGVNETAVAANAGPRTAAAIRSEVRRQRAELELVAAQATTLMARDGMDLEHTSATDRAAVMGALQELAETGEASESQYVVMSWLGGRHAAAGAEGEMDMALAVLLRTDPDAISRAITGPSSDLWLGAFTPEPPVVEKSAVRYRSAVNDSDRWQLVGALLLGLAGFMLVVVGPVVTATHTAREREAGTLPVLRMTGLSATDLAAAMAIGPNVFSFVCAGGLLVAALPLLLLTGAAPMAIGASLGVLAALAVAAHLAAIGLGDALGQKVNAMVVGGLLGAAITGPGLVGALLVGADVAATGLLLGPLPAVVAGALSLSPLSTTTAALSGGASELGTTILGYALVSQGLLGLLCLASWQRRVEHPWSSLFRPMEGVALALASVGCAALAIFDLSERIDAQSYDAVNLITFAAVGFLVPALSWVLVASLTRPRHASALTSAGEARRAFLRFQGFLGLSALALGGAYAMVLHRLGLDGEPAELMWATLAQGLLVAETGVATLLLVSRRRGNALRTLVLGGAVMAVQLVFAAFVYGFEVEFVATTQKAGMPFLYGMEASPYWLAFLVVLWSAGFGLILAALLNERDRRKAAELEELEEDDDDGEGDAPNKWLH